MTRFVFFNPHAPFDAKELGAAQKIAKANGATVVRATMGSMLLEGSPEVMERVATSLSSWRYEPDRDYRLEGGTSSGVGTLRPSSANPDGGAKD